MKRRKGLKRTPLARTGKLERKAALKRKRTVNRRNARRKAAEFARAYGSEERVLAVQALPCVVCGALPSENAHVRSRGAGGGASDIVPLCREHHQEQHTVGVKTFGERYGINLSDEATKTVHQLEGTWTRRSGP